MNNNIQNDNPNNCNSKMKFTSEFIEITSPTHYFTIYKLEYNDPHFKAIKKLNFAELADNEKIEDLEICNYYRYSISDEGNNGFNNDDSINIYFDARYDNSFIMFSYSKDNREIHFAWRTGDTHMEKCKYEYLKEKIQNEVLPELINKLISL